MIRALLIIVSLLAVSCVPADREVARPAAPAAPILWPPPPEQPRISFLYALRVPEDLGYRRPFFERLWHIIVGEENREMIRPQAVAVDGSLIAVADPGAPAIHLFEGEAQEYRRLAKAGEQPFSSPVGVALAPDRLYVSDSALEKVFIFDRAGRLLRTITGLARPTGLAFDGETGRLYVAETLGHRIVVFDSEGKELFAIGNRGRGAAEFNFPTHIAVRARMLYVTDTMNFRLQALDLEGNPVASFGRHGDGSGDFALPKGVGADAEGHIYVVDALFNRVQIFDPDGTFLLAFGEQGNGPGQMWLPSGLFIEADRIYVADSYNRRVQVFEFLGRF